ncbi:uncharacterized protein SCHCODRAFT_02579942 [Schizophyllum commune H4-8]|nr:uncharacterized protein SCHCODRAFT_02579942 [Schizophyllum commune H4-8]KAI5890895.1 hypothetical protein SCHCODRAFT_02579942 [Schizophyllum commune H4-8]
MAPIRTSKAAKKKECYSHESLPGFVNNICEGCGVRVLDRHNQKMHKIGHLSDNLWWADAVKRPYRCTYCGMGFSQSNGCRRHEAAFHDASLKKPCPDCDKAFACLGGLLRHRRKKHNYETPNPRGPREEPYEMASSTGPSKENTSNDSNDDKQAPTSATPQTEISPLHRTREWVNRLPTANRFDENVPSVDSHNQPYDPSVEYVGASGHPVSNELVAATFDMTPSTLGYDYSDFATPIDTNFADPQALASPFGPAFDDTPWPAEDTLHLPVSMSEPPSEYAPAQDWFPPIENYDFHSVSTSRLSSPLEVTSLPPVADFAQEHCAPAAFDQPAFDEYGWLADATTWSPDETNNASPNAFDFDYGNWHHEQPAMPGTSRRPR